jgi:CheY-like chemotaxis protein
VSRQRTLLVVEDGTEYTEALRSLVAKELSASIELVRAGDADEARRVLAERTVDAVFLDVVFDRTPPERLAGDLEREIQRFGGDRRRAERHLAENQGFYLVSELAPLLPGAIPVVIAYDFSAEPERLAALRRRCERLSGLTDGTPISAVMESLLAQLTSGDTPDGLP